MNICVLSDDLYIPDANMKQVEAKVELKRVRGKAYGRSKPPVQRHWVHLLITVGLWSLSDACVSGLEHVNLKVFEVQ